MSPEVSGKETALPPSPPLRTVRESFDSYRSSLTNAPCGTRFLLSCLHNTRLQPTHIPVGSLEVNVMPTFKFAGSCTSRFCFCHLLCFLNRFLKLSCDVRPRGSLLTFARDDVALLGSIPIPPITGRHSLFPLSFTRCCIENTLRCLYPEGQHRAYHVPCTYLYGVGPTYSPAVHCLRQTRQQRLILTTYLLVQAYQHLSLVNIHDVYQWFTYVDHTAPS